jgi:superfamily II DNA or RNA helicase
MTLTLTLLDEVNCCILGLPHQHKQTIIRKTGISVPGAFQSAAFLTKNWDGKTSFFGDDGVFFQYMIPQVLTILEEVLGYNLDTIEIVDERDTLFTNSFSLVDDTFLLEETGNTLHQHQVNGINTAITRKKGTLEYATNAGKEQPLDSSILTPTGWKTMGDIEVGALVIGSNGTPVRVSGVFPQGTKDVYQVSFINGQIVECGLDHLWAVRDKHATCRGAQFKPITVRDLIGTVKQPDGSNRWQIPIVSPVEFESSFVSIDPYVLGLYLGDGSSHGNVCLSNNEKDIQDRFIKGMHPDDTVWYGISLLTAHHKFIPNVYMYNDTQTRLDVLRGLLDTDGYVYKHYIEFSSMSVVLATQVQELVRSLGGHASIAQKEAHYTKNGERTYCGTAYRVYIRFAANGVIPVSSEKHLAKYIPGRRISNTISDITKVDQKECRCISVDATDGLYVTGGYILTHNTSIALGISKAFDPHLKSIVVVPSESLVRQTYDEYAKSDLSTIAMTAKISSKKRAAAFEEHRHVILTYKLLLNCLEYIDDGQYVLIVDEIHSYFGDVFANALRVELGNCPVRIGLTGTYPRDKYKKEKIACHMGHGVLDDVSTDFLIKNEWASNLLIHRVETVHPHMEALSETLERWDWDMEANYLATHRGRIEAIVAYLKTLEPTNTLVLCHPQMGKALCKYFNNRMVVDITPVDTRREWFAEFDKEGAEDVLLFASFNTSGQGISQNRILRLVLIDAGKDQARIRQSIGRGLRLDGKDNQLEVIDISSRTKYSARHTKKRLGEYKKQKFPYTHSTEITVEDNEL